MKYLLGLTCRGLVAAAGILIVYAVYDAVRAGEPNPTFRALPIVVGAEQPNLVRPSS